MNAVDYAKLQLEEAFGLVNIVVQGLDEEQYNWQAEGTTCNSVAKSHAHALSSIDFFVNGVVGGGEVRWASTAEKMGLPGHPLGIWQSDARIPLEAMQEYGKQVHDSAMAALSKLSDADLDREIETQYFGKKSAAWYIQLAGLHTTGHAGDMASVKGMQGLKGLPF